MSAPWPPGLARACLPLVPHGPFSAARFCPGPAPEPLSSGSLTCFVCPQRRCVQRAGLWIVPRLACPVCPLLVCRSGIYPGGGLAVSVTASSLCAASPGGWRLGPCWRAGRLSPPWLISYPGGDFRPCQHPVPVNFLLVGSGSLTILPNPGRWLAASVSTPSRRPRSFTVELCEFSLSPQPVQCCCPLLSLFRCLHCPFWPPTETQSLQMFSTLLPGPPTPLHLWQPVHSDPVTLRKPDHQGALGRDTASSCHGPVRGCQPGVGVGSFRQQPFSAESLLHVNAGSFPRLIVVGHL